jgi:exodeoxyribonuclease VII large subunit
MTTFDSPSATRVWRVAALVQAVADALQARFATVTVRAELSGFTRAASGHAYFTLKDDQGQAALRCAMFRRAFAQAEQGGLVPREGLLVEAVGQLSVYGARGELQLVVERLRPAGEGAWYEQFLRLKARLAAEGLFDAARKRPLPIYPRRVAVITSSAAAALRDVLHVLARRCPHVEVWLVPCAVQGADAPPQIVAAFDAVRQACRDGMAPDAVLLCRGGGSIEDLWSFNDERVVRAVVACPVPVVCGVGHETDVTLADFAADLRAPTPSAAAEVISRDRIECLQALDALAERLRGRLERRLNGQAQHLDRLAARLSRPGRGLVAQHALLDRLAGRLARAATQTGAMRGQDLRHLRERLARAAVRHAQHAALRLDGLAVQLHSLSPQRVLERGYVWLTREDGRTLQSAGDVVPGDAVRATLQDGVLRLNVTDVHAKPVGGD